MGRRSRKPDPRTESRREEFRAAHVSAAKAGHAYSLDVDEFVEACEALELHAGDLEAGIRPVKVDGRFAFVQGQRLRFSFPVTRRRRG